jgi:hypothetical protein
MGGCTGHQGVVILRPLAGRFLKAPLGKQKTGHHPEDELSFLPMEYGIFRRGLFLHL